MKTRKENQITEAAALVALMEGKDVQMFDPDGNDFCVINFSKGKCLTHYAMHDYKLSYPTPVEVWFGLLPQYTKKKFTYELA